MLRKLGLSGPGGTSRGNSDQGRSKWIRRLPWRLPRETITNRQDEDAIASTIMVVEHENVKPVRGNGKAESTSYTPHASADPEVQTISSSPPFDFDLEDDTAPPRGQISQQKAIYNKIANLTSSFDTILKLLEVTDFSKLVTMFAETWTEITGGEKQAGFRD
ncbi:hypothetical protein BDM02DRAFT_3273652 [Thelephora ganbajun]|uniref:Uncharacterized protein n=1 Tax=Thelephora ganbajun TaxID=370292 RepID=A0ACB6YWS6_THEGA|nr:hypothetical protein BDM02DRAFT_3273652 [Thelephora ganbajun]